MTQFQRSNHTAACVAVVAQEIDHAAGLLGGNGNREFMVTLWKLQKWPPRAHERRKEV